MTYDIIHKNSTIAGTPPTSGEIEIGEIAINAADAELYVKDTSGNIRKFQNTTTGTAAGVRFTQTGTALQRTVESKLKDVVSAKDFGVVGDGVVNDTAALQAFFTYIAANDVGTAYCSGTFLVSAPITFGTGTSTATKHIIGDAYIRTSTTIDTLFTINGFTLGVWDGFITVQGTGSVSYASRTCGTGLVITNSGRATFTALRAARFRLYGIKVTSGTPGGNTTLVNLGDVDVSDCGTGYPGGSNLTASWSNPVNTGSSNSTSQRTTIDVSTLPTYASENTVVLINGETYYVYSVDSVNNKLTIFPWIDGALTSGSLTYIQGAGLFVLGSDAGVVNADMVDATRCSVGLWSRALYGIIAKRVVTQFCLSGFAVGEDPSAAAVTFSLNGFYCEANTIDLLRITRSDIGGIITAEYAFDFSKVKYTTDARPTGGLTYANTFNNLRTITIQTVQGFKRWKRSYYSESPSSTGLELASKNSIPDDLTVYYRDSWTINLSADTLYTVLYGDRSRTICFIGSGVNNAPTGTFTFNAPSGKTVNGGASAAFTGFNGPAVFYVYYNANLDNVIVACPNQRRTGSVTYNPPSISSGSSVSTTVTCTGATLGDFTDASFSLSLAGLSLTSYVNAADQVTVVFTNNTGATVDLASATLRVTAVKSV